MLKALYDYGVRQNLTQPPGFSGKTVKAYISLSEKDDHISIYMGDKESVLCPDIGSLAQGRDKCNILVEKRSIVVPDAATEDGKLPAKSQFFLETLRSASEAEPLLKVCVRALETPETIEKIREELDRMKIKPGDTVSFRVNGQSVLQSEKVRDWWKSFRKQFSKEDETPSALCLITGEPTHPMATTTPIQDRFFESGKAKLICFDKLAFCSYNQKQAANAPVSEEAFSVVKAALDELLKDAPVLAGMKFVHWFDREIPKDKDLFNLLDDLGDDTAEDDPEDEPEEEPETNEAAERKNADTVPESVKSGNPVKDLDDVSYYILLLTGVKSRVMIRRYDRGNYADLRRNINQWYADLALTNYSGTGNIKQVKLAARLIHLLKFLKSDSRPLDRLPKELAGITPTIIQAILTGGILPDAVASKALTCIRSKLLAGDDESAQTTRNIQSTMPDSLACQWLKVWLLRKNRMNHQEVSIVEEYNLNLSNSAYHCGGLMAVYAAIQRAAMPDVNTGIVERYYASAIQMPALAIGQLSRHSNYHLEKMENKWLADRYRENLQQVSVALGKYIPATLNLEQQSYFALGYYQMGAKLNKERKAAVAASKERTAAAEQ